MAIEMQIQTRQPHVDLRVAADKDALPLVRQALRALGTTVGADPDAICDAELAVTEACTNAIRHAYGHGSGTVDVAIDVRDGELLTTVRDQGSGIRSWRDPAATSGPGGLGLTVIESVTSDVEIHTELGVGTEVVMSLSIPGVGAPYPDAPGGSSVERVVCRVLAVAGAQADFPPEQLTEMLLASELIARHLPDRLVGDQADLRIDRVPGGIELRIGPLEDGGGQAILRDVDLPGLGPVVERLAEHVRTVAAHVRRPDLGERLVLLFAAPA